MTRVYLVRHGTTEWNKEEIFRGRADCSLNEKGREEGKALAAYFRDIPLLAIYSSPLVRAMETAETIAAPQNRIVIPEPAFTDLDFGLWQGLTIQEVKESYPDLYRAWRERPHEVTFPQGENLAGVRDRAWQGLMRRVEENRDQTFLIVTHRVVTKILLMMVLGLDLSQFWRIQQNTAAVNCLDHTGKMFIASLINDTCHLGSIPAGAS